MPWDEYNTESKHMFYKFEKLNPYLLIFKCVPNEYVPEMSDGLKQP